jgi:hypothetical protein
VSDLGAVALIALVALAPPLLLAGDLSRGLDGLPLLRGDGFGCCWGSLLVVDGRLAVAFIAFIALARALLCSRAALDNLDRGGFSRNCLVVLGAGAVPLIALVRLASASSERDAGSITVLEIVWNWAGSGEASDGDNDKVEGEHFVSERVEKLLKLKA